MANEINISLAISGSKAGITSAAWSRGLTGILANMAGNFVAQGAVLANHLGNGVINAASNAFPIVITTTTAHGLTTGETVVVAGVTGNTNANGTWVCTVVTATTFSIPTVGNAAYISGGTWRTDPTLLPLEQVTQPANSFFYNNDATNYIKVLSGNNGLGSMTTVTNANPIQITTPIAHNLTTGTTVVIAGVLGNTAANGTFSITKIDATNFTIPIAGTGAYTVSTGYWFSEPVTSIAKIQPGIPNIVTLDDLVTPYCVAPVLAAQLEYLIFSL